MCRNHRGFVEAMLTASRLGADLLLLNTDFPGPQLAQALAPHAPGAIVHDEEFGAGARRAPGFERRAACSPGTTATRRPARDARRARRRRPQRAAPAAAADARAGS